MKISCTYKMTCTISVEITRYSWSRRPLRSTFFRQLTCVARFPSWRLTEFADFISCSFAVTRACALFRIKIVNYNWSTRSIRSVRHFSSNSELSLYGVSFFANWKIIEFAFYRLPFEASCLHAIAFATRFENIEKKIEMQLSRAWKTFAAALRAMCHDVASPPPRSSRR